MSKIARQIEYLVYGLLLVGLIFIYNSSIVHSQNVFGNPHRFFMLHMGWVIIGLACFKVFSKIDFHRIVSLGPTLFIFTTSLLVFLAFWGVLPCSISTPFAPCLNSANRWLVFNPAPLPKLPFIGELSFQPSELAKIAIIIFLAFKFKHLKSSKNDKSFLAYILYTGLTSFLVILEPNMSTAILVFIIGSVMYFTSGENIKPFLYLVPIVLLVAAVFVVASPYRRERLLTYVDKSQTSSKDTQEGYQVRQVKIALGSGGLFGVGFGQSRQKYTYLPEVATDSIFAVIGEEFGFLGSLVVSFAFLFLFIKGIELSKSVDSYPGRLICIGIITSISSQFLVHMAANAGLIPYTGVPLPLISYGGSSLLFTLISLGILVNIANTI